MSSTLVSMTCDDSIYRSKAENPFSNEYFIVASPHLGTFSDKSFWWYKK